MDDENNSMVTWQGTVVYETTNKHHHVIRVQKITGDTAVLTIPAEVVDDPRALRRELISQGAQLPALKKASDKLLRGLVDDAVPKVWKVPAQPGWLHNEAFMIGDRIIGSSGTDYSLPPGHAAANWFSQSGTLKDWKAQVARRGRNSSVMMTIMCTPFAAIVKHLVGVQNFSLGVAGPSKSGKSTCLVVAASVYGIGTEQGLPTFNATNLSIQEVAHSFNSLMLPLNELSLISGPKTLIYESVIRPLVCCYAEGSPRRRSDFSAASIKGRDRTASWNGIMVYTSEDKIAALAKLGKVKRYAGELARCHEIAATRDNQSTVFDRFPKHVEKSAREAWARGQLSKLRGSCEKQHGTAIEFFVTALIAQGQTKIRNKLTMRMREFLRVLQPAALAPEVAHAGRNFALLYAAGALAIEAGVLPWDLLKLRKAILRSFRGAHTEEVDRLDRGKDELRKIIALPTLHRKARGRVTTPTIDCIGYVSSSGLIHVHATFLKERFDKSELSSLLVWLHVAGHLKPRKGKAPDNCKATTNWAECTVKWPDGKVHRTFRFRNPFVNKLRKK